MSVSSDDSIVIVEPQEKSPGPQELAFLGSVGVLVENFAKNLDDFIGNALDEWNSPSAHSRPAVSQEEGLAGCEECSLTPHHTSCVEGTANSRRCSQHDAHDGDTTANVHRRNKNKSTKKKEVRRDAKIAKEPTAIEWSWNDFFFEDDHEESGWIGTSVHQQSPSTDDYTIRNNSTGGDDVHQRKEHVRHALEKNPLDRYKKQNAWLKSKVLGLQKRISSMEEERLQETQEEEQCVAVHSLEDEHVTLQMQIEELLSQKSRLACENDLLKRENDRLNELIEYFFASTPITDEAILHEEVPN